MRNNNLFVIPEITPDCAAVMIADISPDGVAVVLLLKLFLISMATPPNGLPRSTPDSTM